MNREFLLNILFLLFVNLLIKPFYVFGVELTIQNEVGKEAYGLYFALFNFTLTLQIVSDLGIYNFNNRHIAQHPYLLSKYFSPMLVAKGLLSLLYFFLVIGIGFAIWMQDYGWRIYTLLLPVAFNQLLSSLLLFLRSNVSGLAMYRTDSLISVLDRLLLIIICLTLLQIPTPFQIEWFIYAQTVSLSSTVIIAFLSFRSRLHQIHFRINWVLLRLILKKSFPYALMVLFMGAYSRLDGVFLERLLPNGRAEAGVYAYAYRLLDAVNLLGFLFAGLLLPMFARLLQEKKPVGGLLNLSYQFILAGALPVVMSVVFFRHEIMHVLNNEATQQMGDVLAVLMLSFIAHCTTYIYGSLLTANQNLRQLNWLFIIAFVINVTLNLLFIPLYRSIGAAAVACCTQFFVAIGQMWFVHKGMRIPFSIRFAIKLITFLIFILTLNYFTYNFIHTNWILQFLISLTVSILSTVPLGFIQWKLLLQLLRNRQKN